MGNNRIIRFTIILLVLATLFIGVSMYTLYNMRYNEANDIGGLEVGVIETPKGDVDFKKELQDSVNQRVEDGMINIFMNTNIELENNDSKAKLLIQNNKNNKYAQQINIVDKNGEVIYESVVIMPGYKIEEDYFSSELSKGLHECMATVNILSTEDNSKINSMNIPIKINVKN